MRSRAGRIISISSVASELQSQKDKLSDWVKARNDSTLLPLNDLQTPIQRAVAETIQEPCARDWAVHQLTPNPLTYSPPCAIDPVQSLYGMTMEKVQTSATPSGRREQGNPATTLPRKPE